ncbi:MAG TPA: nitrous oxide reductase accessory protein NosL [Flavobacterium sp.]|uniref:nitrous oxide reductase accessory protein NosL n=1 Tax=Flavobacterium sp. TaxID=239 RepID=UPI002CA29799|nr:nitrous oxide reductase accessory protein NosL [Flavobacterium sp.]HSD14919.1 nitrous oxide reductase accessory protein NosL [Flavobacterium sp.]
MKRVIFILFTLFVLSSCSSNEPKPLKLNSDSCDNCKMTISNGKFGAELITEKGRIYKFDDIHCMVKFAKSEATVPAKLFYINDYTQDNTLIPAEKAFYLKGGTISSPMRGNTAAFSTQKEAEQYKTKLNATSSTWDEIYNSFE